MIQDLKHKKMVQNALATILRTKGIKMEMDPVDETQPLIRGGVYGGKEGFYFRKDDYQPFTDYQKKVIENTFPINIDSYTLNLEFISDVEYDEDRIFPSGIHITFKKNSI